VRLKRQLRRTAGFSLIELLIVVAIIAALVGVAVPMFQKNIAEAHRAKAQQDLDTLRNAITLHDSQNRPLIGTDLKPLLGRYLQEIPNDPWGNPYLLDAGMGLLISFGADQKAGGNEEDADLPVRYKSVLKIQKAVYTGNWGLPAKDAKLRVLFNKPFSLKDGPSAVSDLELILDAKIGATIPFSGGGVAVTTGSAPDVSWGAVQWEYAAPPASDPDNGLLVMNCKQGAGDGDVSKTIRLSPSMAINIKSAAKTQDASTGADISNATIREKPTKGGPCDEATYGSGVLKPDGAHPIEKIGTENRGVTIERAK
jgi:general secretion pathway protein G